MNRSHRPASIAQRISQVLLLGLLVLLSGISLVPHPTLGAASAGCITAYTGMNYTGTARSFCAGTYNPTTLSNLGFFRTVSSLQVGANARVTLCAYADCSLSPTITFTTDVPNLGSYSCGATPYCDATWDHANRWIVVENLGSGGGVTVDLQTRYEFITSPAPYTAGQTVTACAQVGNYGTANAGASTLGMWVATSVSQTPIDSSLKATLAVPPILAGANTGDLCTSVVIPANLTPGTYHAIFETDTTNQVAESREDNNSWYQPFVLNTPITPVPVTPVPVTPVPVTPAPVTPAPVTPAPVTPAPVTPVPVTPVPVTPVPVTPVPVTPAPVTPAPVTPLVWRVAWESQNPQGDNNPVILHVGTGRQRVSVTFTNRTGGVVSNSGSDALGLFVRQTVATLPQPPRSGDGVFACDTWTSPYHPVAMQESSVLPGGSIRFEFDLCANAVAPGIGYRIDFGVAHGSQFIDTVGADIATVWFPVRVITAQLSAPVAKIIGDIQVNLGQSLHLDASTSFDPDGGNLTRYVWRLARNPEGQPLDIPLADSANPIYQGTALPAAIDRTGSWTIQFTVTDDEGSSSTVERSLTVGANLETWIDRRFYLNQRALGANGGNMCSMASIAMVRASAGLIGGDFNSMRADAELADKTLEGPPVSKVAAYLGEHGMVAKDWPAPSRERQWSLITQEINAGRPVIFNSLPAYIGGTMNTPGHYLVVVGYRESANPGERQIIAYDPYGRWNGTLDAFYRNALTSSPEAGGARGKSVYYRLNAFGRVDLVTARLPGTLASDATLELASATAPTVPVPTTQPDEVYVFETEELGLYQGTMQQVDPLRFYIPLIMR